MKNIPLIMKSYSCFRFCFSDYDKIETSTDFYFVCPKCKNKLAGSFVPTNVSIQDINFCSHCGCKIDGKKAYEITDRYKDKMYYNSYKFICLLNRVCKGCKNFPTCEDDTISMCDTVREHMKNNMDIVTRIEVDTNGNQIYCLNNMDDFEDLVNGKE